MKARSKVLIVLVLLLIVLGVMISTHQADDGDEMIPVELAGANYGDEGVTIWVTHLGSVTPDNLGESPGPLMSNRGNGTLKSMGPGADGGGSGICCISLPKKWRPGILLLAQWETDTQYDANKGNSKVGQVYKKIFEVPYYPKAVNIKFLFYGPEDVEILPVIDDGTDRSIGRYEISASKYLCQKHPENKYCGNAR